MSSTPNAAYVDRPVEVLEEQFRRQIAALTERVAALEADTTPSSTTPPSPAEAHAIIEEFIAAERAAAEVYVALQLAPAGGLNTRQRLDLSNALRRATRARHAVTRLVTERES